MPLTCGCGDAEDAEWFYEHPHEETTMPARARRARCANERCRRLLNEGDTVLAFPRHRYPRSDVEEDIHGYAEIPMATWYLCEPCGDIWWSLFELGYECVAPNEVGECLDEYVDLQGDGDEQRAYKVRVLPLLGGYGL